MRGDAGRASVPGSRTARGVERRARSHRATRAFDGRRQYRYGGADPREGFDCSGLVYYTFPSNGHDVPRTSREQFEAARKISLAQAAEGDLVFFQDLEKLSHVGIYLGDGQFVHAPSSGSSVSVASIDAPYYQRHLIAVGRLLP